MKRFLSIPMSDELIQAAMAGYLAKLEEEARAKRDRLAKLPPGACQECEGEGDVGGQFCGGYQPCEACNGTGVCALP